MAAEARAALDRGLAQGGTVSAQNAQLVQLLGADTTGWTSVLWSIKSYPEAFALPGGWSLNSETGAYESTATRPPGFHLPSGAEPAKLDIDLTVDGVTDSSLRIVVPSRALGLVDTALAESTARSGFRGFVRDVNRNWRLIDRAFAGIRPSASAGGGDGGVKAVPAVAATPGWYVVGAFRRAVSSNATFRLIGCVANGSLTMRGRLFDLSSSPPAPLPAVVTTTSVTPVSMESASVNLTADHNYQMQVEVTGGNTDADFGAVHLMQPVG